MGIKKLMSKSTFNSLPRRILSFCPFGASVVVRAPVVPGQTWVSKCINPGLESAPENNRIITRYRISRCAEDMSRYQFLHLRCRWFGQQLQMTLVHQRPALPTAPGRRPRRSPEQKPPRCSPSHARSWSTVPTNPSVSARSHRQRLPERLRAVRAVESC